MLTMTLQYFGHLRWRANSLENALKLGKTEGKRGRGRQRMRWLESITDSMDMNPSKLQEITKDRGAWCAAVHGATKSRTWVRRLNNNNKVRTLTSMFSASASSHAHVWSAHGHLCWERFGVWEMPEAQVGGINENCRKSQIHLTWSMYRSKMGRIETS